VASEDWITVDEVADEIIKIMKLKDIKNYRPMLHGVGWPGDVKRIALKIKKIKRIGFKLRMNSRDAVVVAAENIIKEIGSF
jgi:UDP-glucose 4-epimerase